MKNRKLGLILLGTICILLARTLGADGDPVVEGVAVLGETGYTAE
jgi:hypothetical protein